ncbi:hypothetical protein AMS59_19465 [Lysinibacillus sp. FJAT-14745]|nr:hypothetical protein AMS59_19465 [Lysinibacillus sp. FJAT-14745]
MKRLYLNTYRSQEFRKKDEDLFLKYVKKPLKSTMQLQVAEKVTNEFSINFGVFSKVKVSKMIGGMIYEFNSEFKK